jgi:hypothetical protein
MPFHILQVLFLLASFSFCFLPVSCSLDLSLCIQNLINIRAGSHFALLAGHSTLFSLFHWSQVPWSFNRFAGTRGCVQQRQSLFERAESTLGSARYGRYQKVGNTGCQGQRLFIFTDRKKASAAVEHPSKRESRLPDCAVRKLCSVRPVLHAAIE